MSASSARSEGDALRRGCDGHPNNEVIEGKHLHLELMEGLLVQVLHVVRAAGVENKFQTLGGPARSRSPALGVVLATEVKPGP